jgi:AcrR family transcriptional regulator
MTDRREQAASGVSPAGELEGRILPGAGLTVAERMVVEASVPELKPRVREIVDVARLILDEEGVDALSMRAIAARLDVRAPSLYKHLADKQAIIDVLVADILHENGDVMRAAIAVAQDPVGAIFAAFRRWALEHPQRYALMMAGPLDPSPLTTAAALYSGDPLRWVMRDDLEGAVTFWAFAHGLVDLEITGRLPRPYDAAPIWARGVSLLRHPEDGAPAPVAAPGPPAASLFRAEMPEDVELSPRAQRIVVVARELLEEEGEEGMSMRRIAARLGVRAPSLYKHLPDKKALEDAIVATVLDDLARLGRDAVDAAAAEGADELHALMDAYRDYAVANPALYRLNVRGPLDEGPLVRGAEVRSAGPLVRACHGDGLAAMTIFAFVHGLVDLELKQRIPPGYQLDAIRRRGIEALRPGPAG